MHAKTKHNKGIQTGWDRNPMRRNVIAYLRVSTDKQGKDGLGIDAQRATVDKWLDSNEAKLEAEFIEQESGRKADRPELAKALRRCNARGCTLIVARLDRLTRNTKFLLSLVESNIPVIFCDLPEMPQGAAGKFVLTLLAAVAELESGMISERTKAAMHVASKKGRLKAPPNYRKHLEKARATHRANGMRYARKVEPEIRHAQRVGCTSYKEIADLLNLRGVTTRFGAQWHYATVSRTIKMLEADDAKKAIRDQSNG